MQAMLNSLLPDHHLPAISVSGIAYDSRKVKSGDLFLATRGDQVDGRQFVNNVAGTAAAVLCESPYQSVCGNDFEVRDLSAHKGMIASRFYQEPSKSLKVIAVTGTNGKTSVSHYVAQALSLLQQPCGVVGTLGAGLNSDLEDVGMTTPDAVDLQRMLFEMRGKGADAVCLEASSHGLVQGRLNGTRIETAIFTNISRDHLDYHSDFDHYKEAKKQLFEWPDLKHAVINLDDEFGEVLANEMIARLEIPSRKMDEQSVGCGTGCITFSLKRPDADVYCDSIEYKSTGVAALIIYQGHALPLESKLLGGFNLSNLLAVVSTLLVEGVPFAQAILTVSQLNNVKGRMDLLACEGKPTVVIDYAHTPDALEKALLATRQHADGAVYCVMGCGGDRDKGKRPQMGAVAVRIADHAFVTSDNPRTENPAEIVEDIVAGIAGNNRITVEVDRATAIVQALKKAKPADLVLIAGKGHEPYQEVNGQKLPYSDYAVVEKYFSEH